MADKESAKPLRNEALVVRGGLMELAPLRNALHTYWVQTGIYELSFFGENDMTLEEIVRAAQEPIRRLPQKRIRFSTVGKLRELGLEPIREGLFPHLVLKFETNPSDNQLMELAGVFDAPVENPYAEA